MDPETEDTADPTRRSLLVALGGLALAAPAGAQSTQGKPKRHKRQKGKKDKKKERTLKSPAKPRLIVLAHVTKVSFSLQGTISVEADAVGRTTGGEAFGMPTVGASFPLGTGQPPAKAMRAKLVEQLRIAASEIVPGPLETIAVVLL